MRVTDEESHDISAAGLRIGVVTALFNESITSGLTAGAIEFLEEAGASGIRTVTVPGAFEIPLFAQKLATSGYHAVVCLGAVIEGETDHYEQVANRTSEGLMRVQLDTGVPIAFGVLTVRCIDHAIARSQPGAKNKGREAAAAAVMAARALETLDRA
ncbi:MAG: 6,7-dimethyl-8-ribityllumazine synthase [Actinomycetota bacterium]|nr:6,7-dimethyl-8-ribityllumazine synthase [Actinomycetota bacterium]